jgi:peptidoglycan/xylan/chitin deacetylase (PgdA/CDA1 family)
MAYIREVSRKRELLSRGLLWTGVPHLLSLFPERDSLLVLTYHRIGNPQEDLFDPGVFSATAEEFNDQIASLKRHMSLVNLEEALSFIHGNAPEKNRRCRVLITFDDGYLDNYNIAFPILRSHGVQGVFSLVTSMVGSSLVPWLDHIAYLVRNARSRRFSLRYPAELAVDIDRNGLTMSLQDVLKLYKRPENVDSERFIEELKNETNGSNLPTPHRRFLNWDEAREMVAGGMAIGSHTHSHPVLSQLRPDEQSSELQHSRAILKEQLGVEPDVLAYPVGARASFTSHSRTAAREAGYRAAFSFYGGTNLPGKVSPYDVFRIGVAGQSLSRFRVQSAFCKYAANYWP